MEKIIDKKLAAYSAMAGAMIAMAPNAQALVVYTDIDPDSSLVTFNDPVTIDMDGDGTVDFVFNLVTGTGSTMAGASAYFNFAWAYGGSIAGTATNFGGSNSFYFPQAYAAGATINSSLEWQNLASAPGSLNYLTSIGGTPAYTGGAFANQVDGYLAVRFVVGTGTHYGWFRLDVGEAGSSNFMTIKDFAYEEVPDAGIEAGATTGGVMPSSIEVPELVGVNVYSFGKTIKVSMQADVQEVTVEVMNAVGQQVAASQFNGFGGQLQLDVADGVYFLRMRSGDAIQNKQIYLGE